MSLMVVFMVTALATMSLMWAQVGNDSRYLRKTQNTLRKGMR
jgi:hypothetical protein